MRVIVANMERCRNDGAGETGDPRENPPTSGIVRQDSHLRKSNTTPHTTDTTPHTTDTTPHTTDTTLFKDSRLYENVVGAELLELSSVEWGEIPFLALEDEQGEIIRYGMDREVMPENVRELLLYSDQTNRLSPRRTGLDTRRGLPRIFALGNRVGRCRCSAGFLEDPHFPPALAFRRCSILTSLHPHRLPIVTVKGSVNGKVYEIVLGENVHSMTQALFPAENGIFQDDNAPTHNAGNPFWSVMENKLRVRCKVPESLTELEQFLSEKWYKIPLTTIMDFYVSIPRRILAVLGAKVQSRDVDKRTGTGISPSTSGIVYQKVPSHTTVPGRTRARGRMRGAWYEAHPLDCWSITSAPSLLPPPASSRCSPVDTSRSTNVGAQAAVDGEDDIDIDSVARHITHVSLQCRERAAVLRILGSALQTNTVYCVPASLHWRRESLLYARVHLAYGNIKASVLLPKEYTRNQDLDDGCTGSLASVSRSMLVNLPVSQTAWEELVGKGNTWRLREDKVPDPWRLREDKVPDPWRLREDKVPDPWCLREDKVPDPWRLREDKVPDPWRLREDTVPDPWRLREDKVPDPWRLREDKVPDPWRLREDKVPGLEVHLCNTYRLAYRRLTAARAHAMPKRLCKCTLLRLPKMTLNTRPWTPAENGANDCTAVRCLVVQSSNNAYDSLPYVASRVYLFIRSEYYASHKQTMFSRAHTPCKHTGCLRRHSILLWISTPEEKEDDKGKMLLLWISTPEEEDDKGKKLAEAGWTAGLVGGRAGEVSMEQRRDAPPANDGIIRHDYNENHGVVSADNRTRFASVAGEKSNHYTNSGPRVLEVGKRYHGKTVENSEFVHGTASILSRLGDASAPGASMTNYGWPPCSQQLCYSEVRTRICKRTTARKRNRNKQVRAEESDPATAFAVDTQVSTRAISRGSCMSQASILRIPYSHKFHLSIKSYMETILRIVYMSGACRITSNHDVFGGQVVDYWWRVEFQCRGSPHLHVVVWVEDHPNFETQEGIQRSTALRTGSPWKHRDNYLTPMAAYGGALLCSNHRLKRGEQFNAGTRKLVVRSQRDRSTSSSVYGSNTTNVLRSPGGFLRISSRNHASARQQATFNGAVLVSFKRKTMNTRRTSTFLHVSVSADILQLILRASGESYAPSNGCVTKLWCTAPAWREIRTRGTAERYEETVCQTAERYEETVCQTAERYEETVCQTAERYEEIVCQTAERYEETVCQTAERYEETVCQTAERYEETVCQTAERYEETVCQTAERYETVCQTAERYEENVCQTAERYEETLCQTAERYEETVCQTAERYEETVCQTAERYEETVCQTAERYETVCQTAERYEENVCQTAERYEETAQMFRKELHHSWRAIQHYTGDCLLAHIMRRRRPAKTGLGKVKETARMAERRMEGARVCEAELVASSSHQTALGRAPLFSIAQRLEAFRRAPPQGEGEGSALSCVTGKVSVTPSSVSEEPSNEVKASASIIRRRQKSPYQYVSEFKQCRMIGLRETGCHIVTSRLLQGIMLRQSCMCDNQWIEEGCTQRRAALATLLARYWTTAMGIDVNAPTVRRRLLRASLVASILFRRLPLFRNHEHLRLQWARERRHWRFERQNGDLNRNRYIREVLEPEVLLLFKVSPHVISQQDNARSHVERTVQAFLNGRQVPLLPWPARSPDMSPIDHRTIGTHTLCAARSRVLALSHRPYFPSIAGVRSTCDVTRKPPLMFQKHGICSPTVQRLFENPGATSTGNRTRFSMVEGKQFNHYTTATYSIIRSYARCLYAVSPPSLRSLRRHSLLLKHLRRFLHDVAYTMHAISSVPAEGSGGGSKNTLRKQVHISAPHTYSKLCVPRLSKAFQLIKPHPACERVGSFPEINLEHVRSTGNDWILAQRANNWKAHMPQHDN
ncbi:hypothetical protein PR048_016694 [Dryococelus australis]|uniref:Helitron helicase-like domain-containing protein n=1 Tax=Dryococelus australis TaxID=614101 RepID=A0ABQ9H7H7_9NEOP|nr:hypothetical protein PR048_016694 [Dryococelus australis]